jgi:hypothetical protein
MVGCCCRVESSPAFRSRREAVRDWVLRFNHPCFCATEVPIAAGEEEMKRPRLQSFRAKGRGAESGAALLAFLLLLVTVASYTLLTKLNVAATMAYRDKETARALAEAKAALIGFAAGANIAPITSCVANCPRSGDLPCPDKDNDGHADNPCSNNTITCPGLTCRLGRLPWKTLGLPDLRDGAGERLWYAVSNDFKDSPRRPCGSSGASGCLNSDSRGTITLRNSYNTRLHDGSVTDLYVKSGAVALVIAPGSVLRRQQSSTSFYNQHRECPACVTDVCPSSPPANTPACHAINYLDRRVGWENNENFVDGGTDGFIQGDVRDAQGNVIVNDKILAISYDEIIPRLQQRVSREVSLCLEEYAALPGNNQRYPWAAELDKSSPPDYDDDGGVPFGRLPDVLNDTSTTMLGGANSNQWPQPPANDCKLTSPVSSNTWWLNWKELVFYGVAEAYHPAGTTPFPCGVGATCLTVNPSSIADRRVVVMVAGRPLQGVVGGGNQERSLPTDPLVTANNKKGKVQNYLERENAQPPDSGLPSDDLFVSGPATATFNDVTCVDGFCP